MKNKTSITKKLFIITVVVFAVFIGGTLIVQSLFFGKFYVNRKVSDIQRDLGKFKAAYLNNDGGKSLEDFIYENEGIANLKIAIADNSGKVRFISKPVRSRFDINSSRVLGEFISRWTRDSDNMTFIYLQNRAVTSVYRTGPDRETYLVSILPVKEKKKSYSA